MKAMQHAVIIALRIRHLQKMNNVRKRATKENSSTLCKSPRRQERRGVGSEGAVGEGGTRYQSATPKIVTTDLRWGAPICTA
jgi:hypothetical protein